MWSCLKFDSFMDIDLQTGTKAIAYSGLLGSWFTMIFGLATLQNNQDCLDTVWLSLVIFGFVIALCYAGSCVLALQAVREKSDYKLVPWLVIGFVTSLSVVTAGITLVAFLIVQYDYYYAAACLLLTCLIAWLSTYMWISVLSLHLDFKDMRKTLIFRAMVLDPENPGLDTAIEAAQGAEPNRMCISIPAMVDYNAMRFVSRSAPSAVGEPRIREMWI